MFKRSFYGIIGRLKPKLNKGIRILMYHRVNPSRNLSNQHISVAPDAFKKQIHLLMENKWQVISLKQAVEQIKNGKIRKYRQVVITFDDGYEDNYVHAYPILKAHDLRATIFLVYERIGKNQDFLNFNQIQEMQQFGISFGSHTLNHPDLTEIPDEEAGNEILNSRIFLEKKLGYPIDVFAYPFGRFNSIHCRFLKEADYSAAVSIAPGGNTGKENPYFLRRTEIAWIDTLFDFKNKLQGGFDWRHKRIQRKQGLYPAPQKAILKD